MSDGEKIFLMAFFGAIITLIVYQLTRREMPPENIVAETASKPATDASDVNASPGPKNMTINTTPWGSMPPVANFLPSMAGNPCRMFLH